MILKKILIEVILIWSNNHLSEFFTHIEQVKEPQIPFKEGAILFTDLNPFEIPANSSA